MKKQALITLFIFGNYFFSNAQNIWEIYGGVNTSNVIHSRLGQQIVYPFKLNAPLWNYGFQFGANRV